MRYGFGLLSLLIAVGIIAFLWAKYNGPVLQKGKEAHDQVQPITGKTADGITAQDSVKVDGQMAGGQLRSLLVTSVTPGGYFEQYYGLKVGDKILQINSNDVANFNDAGMAEGMLWQAQGNPITVLRNGQTITLNVNDGSLNNPNGATPTPALPTSAPTPASPAPTGSGIPGLPSGIQVPQPQQ